MSTSFRVTALLALLASTACSTVTAVRENTKAIGGSTDSISNNTAAIKESTKGTSDLVPALNGLRCGSRDSLLCG